MIIAIIAGVWILLFLFAIRDSRKRKKLMREILDTIENFNGNDKYISLKGEDVGGAISFNAKNKKLLFIEIIDNYKLTPHIYGFDQILECEILIDGNTYSKQSNVLGRAAVGGILLGGVGAIVGGMSAKNNFKEQIKSMDLKIITNDFSYPVLKINFLNIETNKNSFIYKNAYEQLEKWHAVIVGLISKVN